MWNALAGYAGLVSVGQQAFFGLGAYFAIRLSDAGRPAYPSPGRSARVIGAALLRCRSPSSCCACAAASSRSACGCVAEARASPCQPRPLIQGETGTSMISLNAFTHDAAPRLNYWLALACDGRAARGDLRAAAQPVRRVDSGDPRRRGGGRLGRRRGSCAPSARSLSWPPSAARWPASSGSRPPSPSSRRPISACSGPPT